MPAPPRLPSALSALAAAALACAVSIVLASSTADAGSARSANAAASASASAKCPLKPSSASPGGEAWAFTATGLPASAHAGVDSTYAHGRGTWTHGHGAGTICRADLPASGPARDIVLKVAGSAHVSPGVTQLGRKGVSVTLGATVSASDYTGCAVGTHGSVTIFASYFQGHHDRVVLRFGAACAAENATFLGAQLHALIARDGRQVNSA